MTKFWIALPLFMTLPGEGLCAGSYVQTSGSRSNIRISPTTSSSLVTTVERGAIFEVIGEEREWYAIRLFSGDSRYIHKSLAGEISYTPEIPEDESLRRQIFHAFEEADERIRTEAGVRYPAERDLESHVRHVRLLEDRYRMEVVTRFGIQSSAYRGIVIEGTQKGW